MPGFISDIPTNAWLFGAATLVSVVAFVALILIPALKSYGHWPERLAAGFLSLFVLVTLITDGVIGGLAYVFFSNDISGIFPWTTS
jgi:hypothetical protein